MQSVVPLVIRYYNPFKYTHQSQTRSMGYTIAEKGTVTIPVEARRRLGLVKGSLVEFVEAEQGVLIVPVVRLDGLRGIDRDRKSLVREMIREIRQERRREAIEE